MKALLTICALAAALGASMPAAAQAWPAKPIALVVPFSAGGPTDTLARIISDPLRLPPVPVCRVRLACAPDQ